MGLFPLLQGYVLLVTFLTHFMGHRLDPVFYTQKYVPTFVWIVTYLIFSIVMISKKSIVVARLKLGRK